MPRAIMLAYDHRGEEGVNLIRQYIEDYAATHDGIYPLPADVARRRRRRHRAEQPLLAEQPLGPRDMAQRRDRGSFSYAVAADRSSYTAAPAPRPQERLRPHAAPS